MEKARLTKAQAQALEKFKKEYVTEEEILEHKFQNFVHDRDDHELKHIPVRTLAIAIYVGYEIIEPDQTAVVTERERSIIFNSFIEGTEEELMDWDEGFRDGTRSTLNKLGITIKGINDKEDQA